MLQSDRVLLVEGRDDREVIYQFCNYHGIDNRSLFSVEPKDGIENLIEDLQIRVRTGVKVLAAVMDADINLKARWDQVRTALAEYDYSLPDTPTTQGTILEAPNATRPKLGIWLMPDNQVSGILEDFLLRLADEGNPLISRAKSTVDSIPRKDRLFSNTKTSKAVIHTWLAWQEEPGTSLGLSITRRYLDPTRNPAPEFRRWLENLFIRD